MASGTIVTAMRPIRLAFVVEPRPAIIRQAMALSSALWGGCLNPIVPVFDKIPEAWVEPYMREPDPVELVNGYLSNFEPDYVLTLGNIGDRNRLKLGRHHISVREIRGDMVEQRFPLVSIGLRDLVHDLLAKEFKFVRRDPAKFIFPACDPAHGLFLSAFFAMPEAALTEQLVTQIRRSIPDVGQDPVGLANYLDYHDVRYIVPRRIQLHQLPYAAQHPRLMVLDPNSMLDVLDFWNLRAAGHRVYPIPLQLLGDESIRQRAKQFIESSYVPDPRHRQYFLRALVNASRSHRRLDEMVEFGRSLGIDPGQQGQPRWMASGHFPRLESLQWQQSEQIHQVYSKVHEAPIEGDTITLEPLKPDIPITGMSVHKRFANLVFYRVQDVVDPVAEIIPAGVATEDVIKPFSVAMDTLTSRYGITRLCDQDTLRSTIGIPSARDVCLRWLELNGWHDVAISAAGSVGYAMIQSLRGVGNVMQMADGRLLNLLDNYASERETHRDEEDEEGRRFRIRNPRGFPFGEWQRVATNIIPVSEKALKEDPTPEGKKRAESFAIARRQELLDFLVDRGVVRLGAELPCPTCSRANWRAINELDYQMRCDFCLAPFQVDPARIAKANTWTYKPHGPFAIAGYGDGAYSVLLTLARLTSLGLSHTSPLLSFRAKNLAGKAIEADLLLHLRDVRFGEGQRPQVAFGECKSMADPCFLQKDMNRMRELATAFPDSILVFSCLKDQLLPEEIELLKKFENDSREAGYAAYCPTIVLTGRELLSSAPFDEQGGFQIYSLHDLASATQVAHLGMQPYGEWLRQKEAEGQAKAEAAQSS